MHFKNPQGLPFCSVFRTSPSNAEGTGSIPGREAKIPHALGPKTKTENRSNIVTNSIKTLKIVHIKKKKKNKKNAINLATGRNDLCQ